jgi:hypothetical protein
MNYICFTSGSCRVLCLFDENIIDKKFDSIHYANLYTNTRGRDFIGKLHTADQHLTFLKYINQEKNISEEDLKRLFSMKTEKVLGYLTACPDYVFEKSIANLNYLLNYQYIFLFEICSIKKNLDMYSKVSRQTELIKEDDKFTNILVNDKDEFKKDLNKLIEYVNKKYNNPLIIFNGHIRNWIFDPEHKVINERQIIHDTILEFENLYKNIRLVDPSAVINLDDLNDPWHYNEQGLNKMHNLIYETIKNYFNPK